MEPATRLESAEEIMQAAGLVPATVGEGEPAPFAAPLELLQGQPRRATGQALPVSDGTPFRPSRRPPLLLVCVLDDGSRDQGEWFRIRGSRAIIGRVEGDITIPHDDALSSRHAELTRALEGGRWRWYLHDLKSTNGTYARVSKSVLKHGQEVLVGGTRFRFEAAPQDAPTAVEPPTSTDDWEPVAAGHGLPALIEQKGRADGQRYLLEADEVWLGSDPRQCGIVLEDDRLASSCHARIYKDARGRWYVENNRTLNGTWLRIDRLPIDGAGQFQMGEQRFLMRIP